MQYRSDIDGLRALAVSAVVLFHAHAPLLPGGYVGVDVFFVISGYLITTIVAGELAEERFSLARFYVRRARRILPALAAMIAASAGLGLWLLLPEDLASLGASIAATALFVSNLLFWRQSGYFDTEADLKPLLHAWSLSVEEQFYLLFPLALMLIVRRRWNLRLSLWVMAAASLVASIALVRLDQAGAFYLLPSRAWELLAGAALAVGAVPPLPAGSARAQLLREATAGLGLALIVLAALLFSRATPFPGVSALLPCAGAALVILAGQQGGRTVVGGALGLRPVVFVGLISYSLYLWHWPILAFARYYAIDPLTPLQSFSAVLAAAAAAILSWRFVERPFRRSSRLPDSRVLARSAMAIGAAAAMGVAVLGLGLGQDRLKRFRDDRLAAMRPLAEQAASPERCVNITLREIVARKCLAGDPSAEPSVALIGDSFADALTGAIGEAVAPDGVAVAPYIWYSCPSILGTRRSEARQWAPQFVRDCRAYVEATIAEVAANAAIRFVILGNNYDWYLNRLSTINGEPILVADGSAPDDPANAALVRAKILATVTALAKAGKTVIFVGASPTGYTAFGAKAIMKRYVSGRLAADATLPAGACRDATADVGRQARQALGERFVYLDLMHFFSDPRVDGGACRMTAGLLPLTTDGSHVTALIARPLAQQIRALVTPLTAARPPRSRDL